VVYIYIAAAVATEVLTVVLAEILAEAIATDVIVAAEASIRQEED
jgi:hypothetical protein